MPTGAIKKINYHKLLSKCAPPLVITTDGMRGALKAIDELWPETAVQRCLIHIRRNTITGVTKKPQLPAGKALKKLADALTYVVTKDDAVA